VQHTALLQSREDATKRQEQLDAESAEKQKERRNGRLRKNASSN
jgi:hypothetical protein